MSQTERRLQMLVAKLLQFGVCQSTAIGYEAPRREAEVIGSMTEALLGQGRK